MKVNSNLQNNISSNGLNGIGLNRTNSSLYQAPFKTIATTNSIGGGGLRLPANENLNPNSNTLQPISSYVPHMPIKFSLNPTQQQLQQQVKPNLTG